MIIEFIRNRPALKRKVYKLGRERALEIYEKIKSFLSPGERILDVGSGVCIVTQILTENGFDVVPLDIKNLSFVDEISPIIYNGNNFPFVNNCFDTVLCLDTLHHTSDPKHILSEAKRVSKRKIIVMENIHRGIFNKILTILMDRIINFDFGKLNHKNDEQWKEIFSKLNLKIIKEELSKYWIFFISKIYSLEK